MRSIEPVQTAFTSGEVDATLFGRVDVARYYAGAALLRNVLVIPQGGVRRRPGMRHIGSFTDGTNGVRVIPFAFNAEQTYALVLTASFLRCYRANGELAFTSGAVPWAADQVPQLDYAQGADTLLLFHPNLAPVRIRRGVVDTSWTIDVAPLTNIPTHDYGGGAEPVISAARGWPECGCFHGDRLYIGGFRSRPATLLGSKVGDYFNFDQGTGLADEAIYRTINGDQVPAICRMRSGRTLQIFTIGAEFAPNVPPPLTPLNWGLAEQTRRGIRRFTDLAELDGATLYVQRGGAALRQFLYSDTEQAYRSDAMSLLAPHLIRSPISIAARRGAAAQDADHVLLTHADGLTTVLTAMRSEDITAFSRWETAGTIVSTAALASGEVFFAVIRANGVSVEAWAEDHLLDRSTRAVNPAGFTTMSGLPHPNGSLVHCVADGAYLGTLTITAGAVTLPRVAYVAEVGLFFQPEIDTLPMEPRDGSGTLIGDRARIHAITARVRGCGNFQMQGQNVVLRSVGSAPAAPLDTPPPVFTGDIRVRGIIGWGNRQQVRIRQPVPGPFTLLALAVELSAGR